MSKKLFQSAGKDLESCGASEEIIKRAIIDNYERQLGKLQNPEEIP